MVYLVCTSDSGSAHLKESAATVSIRSRICHPTACGDVNLLLLVSEKLVGRVDSLSFVSFARILIPHIPVLIPYSLTNQYLLLSLYWIVITSPIGPVSRCHTTYLLDHILLTHIVKVAVGWLLPHKEQFIIVFIPLEEADTCFCGGCWYPQTAGGSWIYLYIWIAKCCYTRDRSWEGLEGVGGRALIACTALISLVRSLGEMTEEGGETKSGASTSGPIR